jgi:hypothetical protein
MEQRLLARGRMGAVILVQAAMPILIEERAGGVDDEDVGDPHLLVFSQLAQRAGHGVLGGEDLEDCDGWPGEDLLDGVVTVEDGDVGDADVGGVELDA